MLIDLRVRSLALGIAVGTGIGAGGAYAYLKRTQPAAPALSPTAIVSAGGIPQTHMLRLYEGYVASFDLRARNPAWVLEYIDRGTLHGEGSRDQSVFFEDGGIEPRFRNKLDDFKDSGYDRGHMAPAANHRCSQKAMNDTFSLSNISPQVGAGFNRDYWARFEKYVKDAAKVSDGAYIVTGPLWLPQPDGRGNGGWEMKHAMIGQPPQLVSVPTHFFKVVLADNASGKHGPHAAAVGAFVMPNTPIDPATPLTAFAVPLEALESVAGAKFFPGFINDRRRAALDEAASAWQQEGRAALQALDRVTLAADQAVLLAPPQQAAGPGGLSRRRSSKNSSSSGNTMQQAAAAAVAAPPPAQQQQQQHQQQQGGRLAKTVNGDGAVHLCDIHACQLPQPGWWENSGRGPSGGSSSSSSSKGGGGGGVQRQNSSGGGGGVRGRPRGAAQAAAVVAAEAPAGAGQLPEAGAPAPAQE